MRREQLASIALVVAVAAAVGTGVWWFLIPDPACEDERAMPSAAVEERWSVDPTPLLDLSSENEAGELLFTMPVGATLMPGRGVLVGDEYDDNLKLIDAHGRLVREIGRSGRGPGEFGDVTELQRCAADSVFVYDRMTDRVTVLDSDARMVRAFRLTDPARSWSAMTMRCASDGSLIAWRWPVTSAPMHMDGSAGERMPSSLYILGDEGQITDSITNVPLHEMRPFGKYALTAMTSQYIAIGTGDSSAIDLYDLVGGYVRTIGLHGPTREPTQEQYAAHIEQLVEPFADAGMRDQWRSQLKDVPLPPTAPPYSNIIADSEGLFWVTLSLPGDGFTLLRVVRPDGLLVADVQLDFDFIVYEVGTDYILGRYNDGVGEPHVALLQLGRPDLVI